MPFRASQFLRPKLLRRSVDCDALARRPQEAAKARRKKVTRKLTKPRFLRVGVWRLSVLVHLVRDCR